MTGTFRRGSWIGSLGIGLRAGLVLAVLAGSAAAEDWKAYLFPDEGAGLKRVATGDAFLDMMAARWPSGTPDVQDVLTLGMQMPDSFIRRGSHNTCDRFTIADDDGTQVQVRLYHLPSQYQSDGISAFGLLGRDAGWIFRMIDRRRGRAAVAAQAEAAGLSEFDTRVLAAFAARLGRIDELSDRGAGKQRIVTAAIAKFQEGLTGLALDRYPVYDGLLTSEFYWDEQLTKAFEEAVAGMYVNEGGWFHDSADQLAARGLGILGAKVAYHLDFFPKGPGDYRGQYRQSLIQRDLARHDAYQAWLARQVTGNAAVDREPFTTEFKYSTPAGFARVAAIMAAARQRADLLRRELPAVGQVPGTGTPGSGSTPRPRTSPGSGGSLMGN